MFALTHNGRLLGLYYNDLKEARRTARALHHTLGGDYGVRAVSR
jgi:hypothetical protein